MWLATAVGLLSLEAQPQPGRRLVRRQFETRFGPPENAARGLCETQDGHLWIATEMGLLEFDGDRLRRYTRRNGLAEDSLWSVLRDREGNLWAGTGSSGTMRISRTGFTTFDESDGSRDASVRSVQMLPNGEVIAVPGPASNPSFRIQQFTGGKTPFRLIRPRFPANIKKFGWGTGQILLRDHLGETWIATYSGVARFPYTDDIAGLDGLRPARIYNMRDGLRSTNIYSFSKTPGETSGSACYFRRNSA